MPCTLWHQQYQQPPSVSGWHSDSGGRKNIHSPVADAKAFPQRLSLSRFVSWRAIPFVPHLYIYSDHRTHTMHVLHVHIIPSICVSHRCWPHSVAIWPAALQWSKRSRERPFLSLRRPLLAQDRMASSPHFFAAHLRFADIHSCSYARTRSCRHTHTRTPRPLFSICFGFKLLSLMRREKYVRTVQRARVEFVRDICEARIPCTP